jgi:hypothetical protein
LSLQGLRTKSREDGSYGEPREFLRPTGEPDSAFGANSKALFHRALDCQRSGVILQIMYAVTGYLISSTQSSSTQSSSTQSSSTQSSSTQSMIKRGGTEVSGNSPRSRKPSLLRDSCHPLKRTPVCPLSSFSRHCRAGLSDAAATRLEQRMSHRHGVPSTASNRETWGTQLPT